MIIGFTGTREGLTTEQEGVLDTWANLGDFGEENHHGDCVGADELFDYFARRYGGTVVIHPPSDPKLRAYCDKTDYGWDDGDQITVLEPKPYLDRNRDIVDACDKLVACPKDFYSGPRAGGTWYTIKYAWKQAKPVVIIWPDGGYDT